MSDKLLFVSHSSADADLAQALVHVVELAFKIPSQQIRCSSVDGYRLESGARTSDTLRDEILSAAAFAVVLTPQSAASSYVSFELGARWGANKQISPLLARGADAEAVPGPLKEVNALSLTAPDQISQYINELETIFSRRPEPSTAPFRAAVTDLVSQASVSSPLKAVASAERVDSARPPDMRAIALQKIKAVLRYDGETSLFALANGVNISQEKLVEYLAVDPEVVFSFRGPTRTAKLID